ncbi:PiggyBac transposable element-derived protein 4 [Trichinella nelsoni]|uniref:PiggyBac transposable element-derived protein 4 n=1 Tax=Trichinella nelsoni TaxID=6336 RepID=A0A0V0SCV1_9BILA|nr:PiggyBac transposable element-derived protein 4 [Trichinella nelsoni]
MAAEAVVHRWAMSMAFLHNNAILPFTFQLVGAYRDVDTESTEIIDSDKESDVTLVSDFKAKHGSDELLEVESDGDVFLYIYDESGDADGNSEDAVIYSELENEYTSLNGIIWRMHILKKREFTFSEVYAALGTIIRAAKYGVMIYWICEADNGYALKGFLYTGRSGEEREIGLTSTIVAQLALPFVQSNRNVFMDRYFTSYSIVQHLLELGLTAVGTVSANRRDVPLCLQNTRGRDVYSTLAVYEHNRKVIMISYVPRKNKNVLLMDSCHTKLKIDNQRDDRRPNIINDYDLGKGGVDSMDSRIEDFSCKRKTNKCTMLMLYLIVDLLMILIELIDTY